MTVEKTAAETSRSRIFAVLSAAGLALALQGCNTVSGLGEDLQESSENVQNAINGDEDPDID